MADITTHAVNVRTLPARREPTDTVSATARRASDLGFGAMAVAAHSLAGALDRFWPGAVPSRGEPSVTRRVARAATGAALVTERRMLGAGLALEQLTHRAVTAARQVPVMRDVLVGMDASIDRWAARGEAETRRREEAVTEFVGRLVPALVDAVLERVDLPALVARLPLADIVGAIDLDAVLERVDLDTVLAQVDLNELLARVDLDTVLRRVDLDGLFARVDVDGVMARVDVNGLLDRIDPDALMNRVDVDRLIRRVDVEGLMARVDLDALMARIDLESIVDRVLDQVDVGAIVRESTGSITVDVMDGARISAMRLDGFVARIADRVLLRSTARDETAATPPPFEDHAP
ncbi:MAG: hypothetical protein ACXVLO_04870 [Acidimicrobiia bacterium]